jgi:hypothetical protein
MSLSNSFGLCTGSGSEPPARRHLWAAGGRKQLYRGAGEKNNYPVLKTTLAPQTSPR